MKVIPAGFEILTKFSDGGIEELKQLERVGRVCYKSEDRITEDGESAKKFVRMLIQNGHEAMIEHGGFSVLFTVDRGVSHEIVRHRLASFAQESTRYCNYSKSSKFPDGVVFIKPCFYEEGSAAYREWEIGCQDAEFWYLQAIKRGATPQQARTMLNNSVKTELAMTANYREWRHFFKLRCSSSAHPQIREVATGLLLEMKKRLPVLFDDIGCAW